MGRSSRQKIRKDTTELNNTFSQLDQIDISPKTEKYTFLSGTHEKVTQIDYILGHKAHLDKFKRIGIIQSILSDCNGIKLDIKSRMITGKPKIIGG